MATVAAMNGYRVGGYTGRRARGNGFLRVRSRHRQPEVVRSRAVYIRQPLWRTGSDSSAPLDLARFSIRQSYI